MFFEPQIILAGEYSALQKLAIKLANEGVGRNIVPKDGRYVIAIYGAGPFQLKRLIDYAMSIGIVEIVDKEDMKSGQVSHKQAKGKPKRRVAA